MLSTLSNLVLKKCTLQAVLFVCVLSNLGTDLSLVCDIFEYLEKLTGFILECLYSTSAQ